MKTVLRLPMVLLLLAAAAGCSSSGAPAASSPPLTATPGPMQRLNPNIVEETDTYFIERFPKKDFIRVDDHHIRHPVFSFSTEFLKEDENYYYIYTTKPPSQEELRLRELEKKRAAAQPAATAPAGPPKKTLTLADFGDITPQRLSGRIQLEEVSSSGLPVRGTWRASFAIADMNGDGIPDIVAPSARAGAGTLQIFLGDGQGRFTPWEVKILEDGVENPELSLGYGGVAVGDIDGDGQLDLVVASHGFGLTALFGDGKGTFTVSRKGLSPPSEFSTQAVALIDVNGDGKLDIVASSDSPDVNPATGWNRRQARLYLYVSARAFQLKEDGILDVPFSNSVQAWDYDGDGRPDILTGSHSYGAVMVLFKNEGNGTFSPIYFPEIEPWGYHFATAPGTFGKDRAPAFADGFSRGMNDPETVRALGVNVYEYRNGAWARHPVWRKKNGKTLLYALAMGDLDGDGLDDVVFADSEEMRLRVFFQQADGSFREMPEKDEPKLTSPPQCIRLADLNRDGRLDIVLASTISSNRPTDPGGWTVYLNRKVSAGAH